jgi:hydrogenase maturation protease
MKTLVIGLGNPILKDDGVGIWTARRVRKMLPPGAEVDVVEVSVGGLALMEAMVGYQRVVLIDAIMTADGQPGQVYQLGLRDLPETLNTRSAHDADLRTALRVGRQLGARLPADEDIHIVAIESSDVTTFGETPTPAVADAIPKAAQIALRLLSNSGNPADHARHAQCSHHSQKNGGNS